VNKGRVWEKPQRRAPPGSADERRTPVAFLSNKGDNHWARRGSRKNREGRRDRRGQDGCPKTAAAAARRRRPQSAAPNRGNKGQDTYLTDANTCQTAPHRGKTEAPKATRRQCGAPYPRRVVRRSGQPTTRSPPSTRRTAAPAPPRKSAGVTPPDGSFKQVVSLGAECAVKHCSHFAAKARDPQIQSASVLYVTGAPREYHHARPASMPRRGASPTAHSAVCSARRLFPPPVGAPAARASGRPPGA